MVSISLLISIESMLKSIKETLESQMGMQKKSKKKIDGMGGNISRNF